MAIMKFAIAGLSALICVNLCFAQAATLQITSPTAIATNADVEYCFARVRGLNPERLPPAYLVLRLHVSVSYRNNAGRPMILPLERQRTVYTSLQPGAMKEFKDS